MGPNDRAPRTEDWVVYQSIDFPKILCEWNIWRQQENTRIDIQSMTDSFCLNFVVFQSLLDWFFSSSIRSKSIRYSPVFDWQDLEMNSTETIHDRKTFRLKRLCRSSSSVRRYPFFISTFFYCSKRIVSGFFCTPSFWRDHIYELFY